MPIRNGEEEMLRLIHESRKYKSLSDLDTFDVSSGATLSKDAFLPSSQIVFSVPDNYPIQKKESLQPNSYYTEPWINEFITSIEKLINLPANWDSYGANRTSIPIIKYAFSLLSAILDNNSPIPSIVPTNTGGIQLEWHTKKGDLEIQILRPGEFSVYFENMFEGITWEEEIGSIERIIDGLQTIY